MTDPHAYRVAIARVDRDRLQGCHMLDLSAVHLEELAMALADQTDHEHRWLLDPRTGQLAFWTSDTGIDGENPVEIDDLDLIPIDPIPSHVWYQDMVDFANGISDRGAGQRFARCLEGHGAFGQFKDQIYRLHPDLLTAWSALRDLRARRRAVDWLLDLGLIAEGDARHFLSEHPSPDPP